MTHIVTRNSPQRAVWQLEQQGMHPLLARLYAARGVKDKTELDYELKSLIPPTALSNASAAAQILADAIEAEAKMLIIGDYDCDGATATAVGVRALKMLGADVDFLLPDRFKLGYGLSPEIVNVAAQQSPDLIITVDNGIASIEGVDRARELGIATLITDHHLPGETLPEADCIVNPNQPGCDFPSKCIAGVGVMFYVMLALRAELRGRGFFAGHPRPNFASLLDLVALGTVADVVKLDRNNRILVSQGLKRMRAGQLQPGLAALFKAAGRDPKKATAMDLGFILGPRLNAAGRLADMRLGVECLLTEDPSRALNIAQQLDALNRERREIESGMQEQALILLESLDANEASPGIALFDESWHEGVVGILASRIKDKLHRPVFAFAPGGGGTVKGSGPPVPGPGALLREAGFQRPPGDCRRPRRRRRGGPDRPARRRAPRRPARARHASDHRAAPARRAPRRDLPDHRRPRRRRPAGRALARRPRGEAPPARRPHRPPRDRRRGSATRP